MTKLGFEKGATVVFWLNGASMLPQPLPDGGVRLQFNTTTGVVEAEDDTYLVIRIPSSPTELTNVRVRKDAIVFIGEPSKVQSSGGRLSLA